MGSVGVGECCGQRVWLCVWRCVCGCVRLCVWRCVWGCVRLCVGVCGWCCGGAERGRVQVGSEGGLGGEAVRTERVVRVFVVGMHGEAVRTKRAVR